MSDANTVEFSWWHMRSLRTQTVLFCTEWVNSVYSV